MNVSWKGVKTMNNNTNLELPASLLMQVRRPLPKRAMTYGELLNVTQLQSTKLRQLLGIDSAAMVLEWVERLANVDLQVLPAYKVEELAKGPTSGFTTRKKNGDYLIAINKNASVTHRRFTLAHELLHLIHYPYADVVYAKLGHGRESVQQAQIERLADHFAAHLLMPGTLVKRAWTHGIQDLPALAGLFRVSEEAMHIRLTNIGLVGDEDRPVATYFRRVCPSIVRPCLVA